MSAPRFSVFLFSSCWSEGLENDMVTLVLSLGRCRFLQHLALGRNFTMKSRWKQCCCRNFCQVSQFFFNDRPSLPPPSSRALTDVLHRIAQLIQDEECVSSSLEPLVSWYLCKCVCVCGWAESGCAVAAVSVRLWLQAEVRDPHPAQCSGRTRCSGPAGHQWKQHGRHWSQDDGQSPGQQHQTEVNTHTLLEDLGTTTVFNTLIR